MQNSQPLLNCIPHCHRESIDTIGLRKPKWSSHMSPIRIGGVKRKVPRWARWLKSVRCRDFTICVRFRRARYHFSNIEFTVKSHSLASIAEYLYLHYTAWFFSLSSLGYCQNDDICSRYKYTPRHIRSQCLPECELFHLPYGVLSVCTIESRRVRICRPHDSFTQCKAFKTLRYRGHQGFTLGER
jgi:hypothetical protein